MAGRRGGLAPDADRVTAPMQDEVVIHVQEPRGTARWVELFLLVFVVIGVVVIIIMLFSGDVGLAAFGLLWGSVFAGVPAAVIVVQRRDLGMADFVLDRYGVHSSHDLPDALVPWEDIVELRWCATGSSINEEALWRLVAVHQDGHETAVSSLGLRRSKGEVELVEDQLRDALQVLHVPRLIRVPNDRRTALALDPPSDQVNRDEAVTTAAVVDDDEVRPPSDVVWPEA